MIQTLRMILRSLKREQIAQDVSILPSPFHSVQFQLLLHREAKQQDLNTSPHSSTLSSESPPSSKLLHAIPTPFKRLHFPQHLLPHFHESKPQFIIVEPLPKLAPSRPPPPVSGSAIPVVPSAPPHERTRRYSLDEVLPDYADNTSRSKVSRRRRSFDFKEPLINTNGQDVLQQEPGPEPQESIPIPVFNHVPNLTDSTRVQDLPQSTLAPDTRDSFTTPFSRTILTGHVDPPPLGLLRFEKPNLELRTADLAPEPSGGWMPLQRERPRKDSPRDVPIREIKISVPASLNNATNFVNFQTAPPRAAPLPPLSDSTRKNSGNPLTGSVITSEERSTSGSNSANLSQMDANRVTNEPARKVPRFSAVAKVTGRLLGHQSQTPRTPSPVVKRTSLPPLVYSTSTPIEQHVLAISTRIKDEFKMKLRNETELPVVDAATEEELIQQVQDVNEDVKQCAKQLAKLLHRSSADKKESKSTKAKKVFDIQSEVRTKLNSFLVTRVFQPFSIQLNEEDDKAVRDRYEEIAPSGEFVFHAVSTNSNLFSPVPQFVASRWRVVASASTSRPIQELGPALANFAADASTLILRNYSPDAKRIKETKAPLVPLIRHAYLLAHFNHLEMITTDYDIFCGTEIGASMNLSQEEEHLNGHSKTRDSRVSGYWSLGLRKKRHVGEGASQRRVWDVLLKSRVLTLTVA
jgi:hypothetical protein